ncbi:MAG: FAD-dependent oxidoreductase [Bryobacteraceae bacterium]
MRLVVIGGVAAGLSGAARARRLDASLEIVVLEKGPVVSYGACGLPYFVEGRVRRAEDLIVYTPEYFERERRITVRTGAPVASIAHARREVVLAGGERVHYDKLLIATGARPLRDVEGAGEPHVFTLHTLDDAQRLVAFIEQKRPATAAVIGAGYIGLEAADALRRRGLRVTMFHAGAEALDRGDPELTKFLTRHLERFGVELCCGARIHSIQDAPGDVVVLATGQRPNTELAAEAGVELGRTGAIRVDDRCSTNLPGVFAAGDCCETHHLVSGRAVYIPLGTTANKMGRVAGATAAGARERFPGIVGTSILSVFGVGIGMTGLSVDQARREGLSAVSARIEAPSKARYFRGRPTTVEIVAESSTGRLLGATVIGEQDVAGRINVVATALHSRMNVVDFAQLDLAYAPPFASVWDPLLIAAQQLLNKL